MKTLPLLGCLILAGCATHKIEYPYTAPSVVAVKTNLERLKPLVSAQGKEVVKELETSVNNYEAQVVEQSKVLAQAQNDANYWHDKQVKALGQLWWWRGLAIAIAAGIALYIGLKTSWRFFL
jgi:anti-sigma-K factor RskA